MLQNEQQFAARVIDFLDKRELPEHIANRLMLSRVRALEAAPMGSLAGRNTTLALSRQSLVGLVAAFLLVLVAGALYFPTRWAENLDYTAIDAAVLSGDLPVQAYLDPGFVAYLRQTLSTD